MNARVEFRLLFFLISDFSDIFDNRLLVSCHYNKIPEIINL